VDVHGREEGAPFNSQRRLGGLGVLELPDPVRVAARLENGARDVGCVETMFRVCGEGAAELVEFPASSSLALVAAYWNTAHERLRYSSM
jgi:hypothetical protein